MSFHSDKSLEIERGSAFTADLVAEAKAPGGSLPMRFWPGFARSGSYILELFEAPPDCFGDLQSSNQRPDCFPPLSGRRV
jgi:hypothetical protein